MKPPRIRFPREDYPEQPEKLLRNLTALSDYVTHLGDGGIGFDNLGGFVKSLTFTAQDPWITPSFVNGWGNADANYPVAYRYEAGGFRLRGLVGGGAVNTVAFSLPRGPDRALILDARSYQGATRVDVSTAGAVKPAAGSEYTGNPAQWTSLDGLLVPTGGEAVPNPAFPLRFRNEMKVSPRGIVLLDAMDVTGSSPKPVSLGNPAWQTSKSDLLITDLAGVVPGQKYACTILVLGG